MQAIKENTSEIIQKEYAPISDILFNTLFERLQLEESGMLGSACYNASFGKYTLNFYTHDYDLDGMITSDSGINTPNAWVYFSFTEKQLQCMRSKLDEAFQQENTEY